MSEITFQGGFAAVSNTYVDELCVKARAGMEGMKGGEFAGWLDPEEHAGDDLLEEIGALGREIQDNADVFVLIGVGGSNNGARAVLKALEPGRSPEILYGGVNLSPSYMRNLLKRLEGKSVYLNVIAKNFATLEPGIAFRFLRHYMEKRYGSEAKRRILVTGSREGDCLFTFSREKGYRFMDFPKNIGGRYSAVSAVGLLPMAAGGIDIKGVAQGAREMAASLKKADAVKNPALRYAALKRALYEKGYTNEILCSFETELEYFAKWWVQLFGESGGKDENGFFPSSCNFSEDLHSMGQYIQQGRPMIIETFLRVGNPFGSLLVSPEPGDADGFGYLDGKDLAFVNRACFDATYKAHSERNPCMIVDVPYISAETFGMLFYFFEYACAASGYLHGTNPFDQDGVEAYKRNLFGALRAGS